MRTPCRERSAPGLACNPRPQSALEMSSAPSASLRAARRPRGPPSLHARASPTRRRHTQEDRAVAPAIPQTRGTPGVAVTYFPFRVTHTWLREVGVSRPHTVVGPLIPMPLLCIETLYLRDSGYTASK